MSSRIIKFLQVCEDADITITVIFKRIAVDLPVTAPVRPLVAPVV
jgi:hypothetical protein